MSDPKDRKLALEVAQKAYNRRRSKQFEFMKLWRNGSLTGIEALDRIVELEKIIFVEKEDFQKGKDKK